MAPPSAPLETTASLLALARHGDLGARERLLARIYKPLLRFAHGRLPTRARDLQDTEDLVQVAMLRALDHIEKFESRHEGSFLAYLRSIVVNLVRDEGRRVSRRPDLEEAGEDLPASGPSPLEEFVGRDALERYDAALSRLSPVQRDAVILRIELNLTYAEIAAELGLPSTGATRMMVTRAIARLGRMMQPLENRGVKARE